MSSFYLIRHGEHDWLPKGIAGRISGVHLNARGKEQAGALPERLANMRFDAIYSSPLERAIETAEPMARARGMEIRIAQELLELDFGEWNGRTFDELAADVRWGEWNRYRSVVRMPGGELMSEVQSRVVEFLHRLHAGKPNGAYALFSHGDAIRAAVCYWLGMPLDLLPRLGVEPASVAILTLAADGPKVMALNAVA